MSYINLFSIKNYPMSRNMPGPEKSPGDGSSDAFPGVSTTSWHDRIFPAVKAGQGKDFSINP
jgi:hypothetical protein